MRDHLSSSEIRKDAVQSTVEAAATAVAQVSSIVSGASPLEPPRSTSTVQRASSVDQAAETTLWR